MIASCHRRIPARLDCLSGLEDTMIMAPNDLVTSHRLYLLVRVLTLYNSNFSELAEFPMMSIESQVQWCGEQRME